MKAKLCVLVALAASSLCAQIPEIQDSVYDDSPNPAAALSHALAPLDKQDITSGLLLEAGMPMINMNLPNGNDTSYVFQNWGDWTRAYNSIFTMALDSAQAIATIDTWRDVAEGELQQGNIVFTTAHYTFQRFIQDSVQLSQLIYAEEAQWHDEENQPVSPYEQQDLFAAAPYQSRLFDTLQASFKFKNSLIFGNQSSQISSIEVDFDNGQGWQNLSTESAVSVTWPDYGEKELKVRVTYANTDVVVSRSRLLIRKTKMEVSGTQGFFGYNGIPDEEFPINSGRSANHAATVQIEYGCGNREITKPLIFLEGFNPAEFTPVPARVPSRGPMNSFA